MTSFRDTFAELRARVPKPIRRTVARLLGRKTQPSTSDLASRSTDELLSLMRHEAHRIEKSIYNDILAAKHRIYHEKKVRIDAIHAILGERGYPADDPSVAWSRAISAAFEDLEEGFIRKHSLRAPTFDPDAADEFIAFLRARRSVRVWAKSQPPTEELVAFAHRMIDAARWAPNSGNRQTWRFVILARPEEKALLAGIKEAHTVNAPLVIFVGMDRRLFGALGPSERSLFIDGGAAVMQMVLLAHRCGIGSCWNHFARDLIESRNANEEAYRRLTEAMGIPDYIEPVALVAIGVPEFLPPVPDRMNVESLLIGRRRASAR